MTVPETDRPSNREAPAPPFAVGRAGQPRKASPLQSAHAQRAGNTHVFSRAWRATGNAPAQGARPMMPHLPPPRPINSPHLVDDVHFGLHRRGETTSWMVCSCGERIEAEMPQARHALEAETKGHAKLADAFNLHRLGRPRHMGNPAFKIGLPGAPMG